MIVCIPKRVLVMGESVYLSPDRDSEWGQVDMVSVETDTPTPDMKRDIAEAYKRQLPVVYKTPAASYSVNLMRFAQEAALVP